MAPPLPDVDKRNSEAVSDTGSALHEDVAWLLDARSLTTPPAAIVGGLCRHLVGRGLPLDRVSVTVGTLHPLVLGRSWLWRSWEPRLEEITYGHDAFDDPAYPNSPNQILIESGGELRRHLVGDTAELDSAFMREMADQGMTDYFGLRIPARDRAWVTVATRRPHGFTSLDIERVRSAAAALGIILEAHVTREIARTVLETYVGFEAGERVLAGEITRGHYQNRTAVIWLCDMRGFTFLSETLEGGAVVALLNDYFERMTAAVRAHGGQILKFVGDAMLAVFPTGSDGAETACRAALCAARDALAAMRDWNVNRESAGLLPVRFGIALHLGDVVYGNIGGTDRLDFTVIGAAVNRVARIETLTATLGHPVLVSSTVAYHAQRLVSCGVHKLRDVPEPVELFTLQDIAPETPAARSE